ncbi:hypothetical protein SAMN05444380_11358 [Thermophagus xiamenensis]|uniref:Uncharacterized protein n=1 Tax=Thermophagus xiamenensis TaxID=385682 RepID=A0A1I2BHF8_9BACT|nr:hypothetical protein SAMN05444380_11358 [Thermophagus xiamenensis]
MIIAILRNKVLFDTKKVFNSLIPGCKCKNNRTVFMFTIYCYSKQKSHLSN